MTTEKNAHPESLPRLLVSLVAWFVATWVLAGLSIRPTPPGGVASSSYLAMLLVPAAIFLTAHHYPRWSVPIFYGAACGVWFAWPIFVDTRTPLALAYGHLTTEALLYRMLFFASGVVVSCLVAFAGWDLIHSRRTSQRYR